MTFRKSAAIAAAAFVCLSPVVAQADTVGRVPVRATVRHGDLNLSSKTGRDLLAKRIDHAVRRACASTLAGLSGAADSRRCRDEMMRDADVQVAALTRGAPVQVAANR